MNNDISELLEIRDIVDLKTAKYLKDKGFHKPTYFYYLDKDLLYCPKGLKRVKLADRRMNHNKFDKFIYSAPTWKEAFDYILGLSIKYESTITFNLVKK